MLTIPNEEMVVGFFRKAEGTPGMLRECSRNAPGMLQECSRNASEKSISFSAMCFRRFPVLRLEYVMFLSVFWDNITKRTIDMAHFLLIHRMGAPDCTMAIDGWQIELLDDVYSSV